MSEKFLNKFFAKLTIKDFKKDKFLLAFHKFYRKEKSTSRDLLQCYTEYITRNSDFKEEDRGACLRKLYDDIKNSILEPDKPDKPAETYESAYTDIGSISGVDGVAGNVDQADKPIKQKGKPTTVKLSKTKALDVLSDFIKQSFIITYEDPEKEYDEKNEDFMNATTTNIIDEIQLDGRKLPVPKKDVVFGQRSVMLGIWQDTRKRCVDLIENPQLFKLLSKMFYLDLSCAVNEELKPVSLATLNTVHLTTDDKKETILPVENFVPNYTLAVYNTATSLSNNHPLQEVLNKSKQKNKSIYICSGSQNICGGNADQGIDVAESMLYMTSSYSVAMERSLHAFPISKTQAILCPNVLIFKDVNYEILPVEKWEKVAVMMTPCKYKPKVKIYKADPSDPDQDDCLMDERLYDARTKLTKVDIDRIKSNLIGSIETALFFGYDTIVLDDSGIEDNWLPAHSIAKITKEVVGMFSGRVKEFIICANKSKSFNVFRLYIA